MSLCPYSLPSFVFVGGSSKTINIDLYDSDGNPFVIGTDITVSFAMGSYLDDDAPPVLTLTSGGGQIYVRRGDENVRNRVIVELLPGDTTDLWGRYVYQVALTDAHNTTEILGQGAVTILRNMLA